ncbi:MAG: flagellar hook basal-body protein [Vampirovibrionales bacterium]|nr:flagellar hook basal-body protein [Vampirovibrionales bacterium]
MNDPFITALNTQKAAQGWFMQLAENLGNVYTPGYREKRMTFSDFINGVQSANISRKDEQGKSLPGKSPTNLFIEGKGFFVVRKADNSLRFTRLGDFTLNKDGTLVNAQGAKVQGYLLGENGEVVNTGDVNAPGGAGSTGPNNPPQGQGGTSQIPTTEISLWADPSNGKFFGKYDEYKIRSDGTVVGLGDGGKTVTPLYKIALVNFINPGGLKEVEDYQFVPSDVSGEPMAGSGEIRSGLIEKSNVDMRENVNYLQQAKLQLDVTAKLISTNKNLLEESLRLLQ